ncbi:ribonuclease H1 [Zerene cesonia]|uniref:ribonuclease H1 n=1 Tax=Zerene cesonia TaxID=33412 RepID=UPI0018E4FA60|nr:ribonuclease H1 [Zerene cesonia]
MIKRVFGAQKVFMRCSNSLYNSLSNNSKMPFYAVAKGRTSGIYMNWGDCEAQVKGFPGARYKKFNTVIEAQDFITVNNGGSASTKQKPQKSRSSLPSSNNNLKRNYSSTSNSAKFNDDVPKKKSKSKPRTPSTDNNSSDDDLNTIIVKQLDDIEARLKGFAKGVDKIYKKGSKGKTSILIEQEQDGDFKVDDQGFVQVYTDGACSANGRKGARAGLGVYWGDGHPLNVSEPVSGRATNNCGEIQAATKAIKQAIDNGVQKLAINTDSQFLINSVTKWLPGWKRKGWKLQSGEPVKNEKDFKELDNLQNKLQIKWNYVEAHRGVYGNEMADQLAKAGATMYVN